MPICEFVENAFDYLENHANIQLLDNFDYRESYWNIIDLFRNYVNPNVQGPLDSSRVVAGAHAVYGWMPRVLRPINLDGKILNYLFIFSNFEDAGDAYNFVNSMNNIEKAIFLRFLDNSLVGTSKFLHFLNPNIIPIWDGNIARLIGVTPSNLQNFMNYWREMIDCKADIPQNFVNFCSRNIPNERASWMRHAEFALFLHSRHLALQAGN